LIFRADGRRGGEKPLEEYVRILVTGGSGFIAAWTIRRLVVAGHTVRVLDIRHPSKIAVEIIGPTAETIEWRIGDIRDGNVVSEALAGCHAVAHLAAILTTDCQNDPVLGAEINLIGTLRVFEASKVRRPQRVVYASSAAVFGPEDGLTPRPITHYGSFKLAMEGCARTYWEYDQISSVGFRPFVVYGPGREVGLTAGPSLACRAAARGDAYTIPYTGTSDMLFVDDVAAALEAALVMPWSGAHVFNLVGEVATIEQVIQEIKCHFPAAKLSAAGPKLPTSAEITPDPILPKILGSIPRTTLAKGIAATVDYYRKAKPRRA
jgi:nucleoside-diphosphate-sugar epimerase